MCIGACIWSGIREVSYFISQEQVAAIRGWGKFMPALKIAEVDDSGIIINGPMENEDMRRMHQEFWTTGNNSSYKHSIHLEVNDMSIDIRNAKEEELEQVNELRKMVNEVHVNGRPDIFRPGFCEELKDHIYQKYYAEDSDVLVVLTDDKICGFATVEYINRPESAYNLSRSFYHVEEFGVSADYRRRGVATAMVEYMRADAKEKGFTKIELDMWEFNKSALEFYESEGFKTYRRYMEINL